MFSEANHAGQNCNAVVFRRNSKKSSFPVKKAVSERPFSAAIFWSTASGNHSLSIQTPAGFPLKLRFVKASTW